MSETRGDLGEAAEPAFPGMRDRLHLAALNQFHHRGSIGEEEFYLPGHHIIEREAAAAIRHMANLDAGLVPEHFE